MTALSLKERAAQLIVGLRSGERGKLARCLRRVDDDAALGREVSAALAHDPGSAPLARVIGVTGNPGAGKSTLVNQLLCKLRAAGKRVAVLAIDPSSPFSGGAILGDRIRMRRHFSDDGVFIRSLATRGAHGGLSRSTFDSVRVLQAAGFDRVLIETVGVGQDEVDVVRLAETSIVMMVPGMGDDIQAIKAGLLEIADVFCVNKADRPGADEVERGLRSMMGLVPRAAGPTWQVPIVRTIASTAAGVDELLRQVDSHGVFVASNAGAGHRRSRQRALFESLLNAALLQAGRHELGSRLGLAEQRVEDGADPFAVVHQLMTVG